MKDYEKDILEKYFQENKRYTPIYIMYLLQNQKVIDAVELIADERTRSVIEPSILRFIYIEVKKLPELIRDTILKKYKFLTKYDHVDDKPAIFMNGE